MTKAGTVRKSGAKTKEAIATIEEYFAKVGTGTAADALDLSALPHLFHLIAVLRAPGGCPWDHEQHFPTYVRLVGEELEELREAEAAGDREAVEEELGDVAWNLLYLMYLAQEERGLPFDRVLRGVLKKIVRRHTHVFGNEKAETPEEVLANWYRLKQEEKQRKRKKK